MTSPRVERELARGTRWPSVRSGLGLLIATWTVLTAVSTALQLLSLDAARFARSGDMNAAAWLAGTSTLYQFLYVLAAVVLVVSATKLTRAPPASRAHPPALAAAASFIAVALLSLLLATSHREEAELRQFWIFVGLGRAVGVLGLLAAIVLVGRAAKVKNPSALVGAAFVAGAIDTGYPLYRLLARPSAAETSFTRAALLAVQLLLAFALLGIAIRVRRGVTRLIGEQPAPASEAPEPEALADEPEASRSEPPPSAPKPPSDSERVLGATLLGVALSVLPLWDAVVATSSLRAFTDALGGAAGTELPISTIAFALGAIVAAAAVGRLMPTAPYAARAVFAIAAIVAGGYALGTGYGMAVSRSHQIDAWPVCDTGLDIRGDLPVPDNIYRGRYSGPRLIGGGEPCTEAAERRDLHLQESPSGDVQDGVTQIATRFPGDRLRFFLGFGIVFLALSSSGWIIARAARASLERRS